MHLEQVQLENFGIYHRHTLDLGKSDLILLYGPNESGKTTALNGLRQALFGFRSRTPYLTAGKTMTAEVHARMADGKKLKFTRRKSRQDEVEGLLDGKTIDASAISQLMGKLDLTSYEQLFGFSLDELRIGEESLKSAQLSEALAGGGLAGINALQRLRSDLNTTLSDLYKARGSRSTINLKLAEIQGTRSELSKVQVLPAEVEELQHQLQELLQSSERLREEHATTYQNRSAIERLLEMLPNYRRLMQLKQQLAAIQLPEGVDMQFVANWSDHSEKRKELIRALEQESATLDQEQLAYESLGGTTALAAFEDSIEQLGHQVDEIAAARERAEDLQESLEDSQAICARLCETLDLSEVSDALRSFVVTPPQRRELESMSRELSAYSDNQIATTAKLEHARRSLAALQPSEDQEQLPSNLDELTYRVKELEAAELNHTRAAEQLTELQNSQALAGIEQQLSTCASRGLQVDWSLPTVDLVQQAGEVRQQLVNRQKQLQQEIAKIDREIDALENQCANVDQSSVQKILAQLDENRRMRESQFEMWEDDLTQPLIAASLTPEIQSERLALLRQLSIQADQLQQTLMESAEAVALFQAGQKQILRMRESQQKQHDELENIEQQLQQWRYDWAELWSPMGITPQSPERMSQWLSDYQRWREHQSRIAVLRRDLHIARGVVRQIRVSLIDLWPHGLRDDTPVSVLMTRLTDWQNAQRDVVRDAQRLRAGQQQIESLSSEVGDLERKRQAILARYQRWFATVPVSQPWAPEQVVQLIDAIEHLRREDEIVRKSATTLANLKAQIDSFETQSRKLARQLEFEISPSVNAESVVRGWFQEVKTIRDQRAERIRLQATIEHRTRRVAELSEQRATLDERLAALFAASGSSDLSGASTIADLVQRAEQLRLEIAECTAALDGQSAGQPLDNLLEQLSNSSDADLRFALNEYNSMLAGLDQQRKQTDQSIGSLNQRIEQMAKSQQAGSLAQTLHGQRNELAELCEQWVVHRLAAELLDRAVDRFSSEHEPVLLQYTRGFLQQLTAGRYQTVEHDTANPTKFVVRNAQGEALEPEKLSTGTREQLYLAIRMAFITNYCENHEPLPVIMDDCFVNFDDMRTANALRSIYQWKTDAQRVLLSCHFRVVQSLAEIAPDIPCIHLQRDERTTVGELAGEIAM